jgi:hypothetical protein
MSVKETGAASKAEKHLHNGGCVTVGQLAEHKQLPAQHLKAVGLHDTAQGVAVPYYDVAGDQVAVKMRTALVAKQGSRWPAGTPLAAYGQWKLDEAAKAGFLILVEGESDCWALWHHGLPALGLPGANTAGTLVREHVEAVEKVYVHREPDQGGEAFVKGVAARLKVIGFKGQALEIRMPEGVKDPADLHLKDPAKFPESVKACMLGASPLWSDGERFAWEQTGGKDKGKSEKPAPKAVVKTLATVQARPVDWLWRHWIPRGALTLIDGDPGLGKSTLAMDLAARVSRGWLMPPGEDGHEDPAHVLLLGAEDGLETTVRPRLDAIGADVSRVHAFEAVTTGDDERPPILPYDLELVEKTITETGIVFVVVDPFMAYLHGELDAHRDQDVRRCMHRLKLLAERTNVAIALIRHLNKLIGGPALYRGGGSIGITGAVRSALVVGRNPSDPNQYVLAPVKCNLAKMPRSLAYTMEPVGDVARIEWVGETDLKADDILAHPGGQSKQTVAERCAEAIRDYLGGGTKEVTALEAALAKNGFAEKAIKAGRRIAGVRVSRVGYGAEGRWMASLPAEPADSDEEIP